MGEEEEYIFLCVRDENQSGVITFVLKGRNCCVCAYNNTILPRSRLKTSLQHSSSRIGISSRQWDHRMKMVTAKCLQKAIKGVYYYTTFNNKTKSRSLRKIDHYASLDVFQWEPNYAIYVHYISQASGLDIYFTYSIFSKK